ncbi:hepatic lectin-like [Clarias gariepinus]|uniref:hepatic lectin-like n=1 Tax=Clarias gariepinus TaxID=13013 RepID=UPI00234DB157|nr:hepatic lectin-like [Clarias gariepinus]
MVQRSTKRMEMVVDIYESADAVRGHDPDPEGSDTKRGPDTAPHTGFSTIGGRCYRVTTVCVVLLCVFLLSAVTLLWIKYNKLNTENNQLQTSNNNLTIERDQLQTCCNSPTKEREQCRSDNIVVSVVIKQGWSFSSSSLYYISTEKKNWTESTQDCRERGADLVIITSREEQNFIIKQLGDSNEAWIGLSKDDTKTKWKWLDGTEQNNSTGVWAQGEPNNHGGNEDCGTIKTFPDMTGWNDKPCFNTSQWICKKNVL